MLSFAELRKLQLGGTPDAVAMAAMIAGGMATNPAALGMGPGGILLASGLAALGGGWIGKRFADALRLDVFDEGGGLAINSSPVPSAGPDGVHLGFVQDTGEALVIPMREWMRHGMIVGQSGVGKTVLGKWLMFQQIQAGGGLMWIDGKLDADNLKELWLMCAYCGRELDLMVLNPGNPNLTNSYNPLLDGDADEVAARCVSLIPTAETNAGADFYRQGATIAITTLVEALQATRLAYNFTDFRLLLTSDRAMAMLQNMCESNSDAARSLSLFLDQFRTAAGKGGAPGTVSIEKMRQMFGGLGSRLAQFGQGKFGETMNTYSPDIRLYDCITQNKIVYVMLPTMGKTEAAQALGKMVVGDFRSAIAKVQALPEDQRPRRPFLGFFDEAGSYVTNAWSRIFEQSRSARLVMVPAFQTKANLEVLGDELLAMVAGNTLTKVFFKPGEPDTAEWVSEMIGKEMQTQYGVSASASVSHKDTAITERVSRGSVDTDTKNNNVGYSETRKEDYKIPAADLMKLGKGECVVTFDGSNVYKVRVPNITFSREFEREVGPFVVQRPRPRFVKGIDLFKKLAGGGDE